MVITCIIPQLLPWQLLWKRVQTLAVVYGVRASDRATLRGFTRSLGLRMVVTRIWALATITVRHSYSPNVDFSARIREPYTMLTY